MNINTQVEQFACRDSYYRQFLQEVVGRYEQELRGAFECSQRWRMIAEQVSFGSPIHVSSLSFLLCFCETIEGSRVNEKGRKEGEKEGEK